MIRVIRHHAPVGVLPLLISDTILLFGCFYLAAEILYPPSGLDFLFLEGGISLVAVAIGTILLAMYFFDLYAKVHVSSRVLLVQQLCQTLGVAILAQTIPAYILRDWTVPRLMMIYGSALSLVALFGWRLLFSALLQRIGPLDKLLFVGHNDTSDAVAAAIETNSQAGYSVIGFLDDDESAPGVLGRVSSLRRMVEEYKPNLLVVGMPDRRTSMPVADLVALRFSGLQIEEASKTYESVYHRVRLEELSEQQVMFSRSFAPSVGALKMARLTNMLLALLCVIVLAPVFIAIALWLRVRSKEPIFRRLPREGENGHAFGMWRFRNDPGLRLLFDRFHVDALPELFNVLRGEMSLVGPQPESPEEANLLHETLPFHHYRNAVPPGITGWAKIHQNVGNREDRALALEYDLYYIKHMSQALNLYILAHSLKNRILRP